MFDPYQELGIAEEATEVEIKKADRKRAKELHPDVGGSDKTFALVARSHRILIDPEKRKHWDEFKSEKAPQDEITMLASAQLADTFAAYIEHIFNENGDITKTNIIRTIRRAIREEIQKQEREKSKIKKKTKFYEKALKRVKTPKENNVLKGVIDQQIAHRKQQRLAITKCLTILQRALEILEDYEYDFEKEIIIIPTITSTDTGSSTSFNWFTR